MFMSALLCVSVVRFKNTQMNWEWLMKVGDLVTQMFGKRVGIVIDLDLCNGEAYVMWASRNTWSELKYLEVI